MSISVVVSTYNRARLLKDCLTSVKDFADEIIVVDNSSTDDTQEVARKFTKHVYKRENNLMLNVNKNFGFTKATKEWILYLDDDEEVTPELAHEIQAVIQSTTTHNGYYIPRKNIIFGKWIEHTGWYPDSQLRLFRNGKGKFAEVHVHEMLNIKGEIGTLTHAFLHRNYESIESFAKKMILIYAPNEAEALASNGYSFSYADAIRMPSQEFLSRFFAREGYKDGFFGLMLSLLMASYHLFVFAYLWEKAKFPQEKEVVGLATKEVKQVGKEAIYWLHSEAMKTASPFGKMVHAIRRRLRI